jgi:ribosome maturation factor RimP
LIVEERGSVPRFVVSGGSLALVEAFNAALKELAVSEEFKEVEIVAHRERREGRSVALTLIIDRVGGVDLTLCERVSRFINKVLAGVSDPSSSKDAPPAQALYSLDVESAGLNRPLVRPDDYERFAGSRVRILTSELINKAKTHRGVLAGRRGNAAVLRIEDEELILPFESIAAANVEYDIRADLTRAKHEKHRKTPPLSNSTFDPIVGSASEKHEKTTS